eukprot:478323-Amphidinium_carterae.2
MVVTSLADTRCDMHGESVAVSSDSGDSDFPSDWWIPDEAMESLDVDVAEICDHLKAADSDLFERMLELIPCETLDKASFQVSTPADACKLLCLLLDSLARSQKWDKVCGSAVNLPSPKALLRIMPHLPAKYQQRFVSHAYPLCSIPLVCPESMSDEVAQGYEATSLRHLGLQDPTLLSLSFNADGTSALLNALFRSDFQVAIGPRHPDPGLVELFTRKSETFHIVDVHGKLKSQGALSPTQVSFQHVAEVQYYLVHVAYIELQRSYEGELKGLLNELTTSASYGPMSKRIMLLIRDLPLSAGSLVQRLKKQMQKQFGKGVTVAGIVNLALLDEHKRCQALNPLYAEMREHFAGALSYESFWEKSSAGTSLMPQSWAQTH